MEDPRKRLISRTLRGSFFNSKFTLVELLVVISIISLLAAMLLPTLQKSYARTRESNCLNNLKQIGTQAYSYTVDFDDHVLPAIFNKSGDEVSFLTYLNNNGMSDSSIFICPSVRQEIELFDPDDDDDPQYLKVDKASYIMNTIVDWTNSPSLMAYGCTNPEKSKARGWGVSAEIPVKLASVNDYSEKIYVTDAIKRPTCVTTDADWNTDMKSINDWDETDKGSIPIADGENPKARDVGYHHGQESYNALMGDGHAQKKIISQVNEWYVWKMD